MSDPSDYTITVRRVFEDGLHVFRATVKELPHVHGEGGTYSEAYEMAIDAIEGLQAMAAEDGAPFPEPMHEAFADWSGRVTLRLPKSLHRLASEVAENEAVSFNQFLVTVVADAVARKSAVPQARETVRRLDETARAFGFIKQAMQRQWFIEDPREAMAIISSPENVKATRFQAVQRTNDTFIVSGLTGNG